MKSIVIFFLLLLGEFSAISQNHPFPQGVDFIHCIKPGTVTQQELNIDVEQYYGYWKQKYLKCDLISLPGGYYVQGNITGHAQGYKPLGSSEGQGYGMIITALMAGFDPHAQEIFDGLFKTTKAFHSVNNPLLMGWVVADDRSAQGLFGSATDGDMDIAYGLILAHLQWGSNGVVDYLNQARQWIGALEQSNITHSMRLNLGDWQQKSANTTRTSDWMLAHMRLFYAVSGNEIWQKLIANTYLLIEALQNNNAPSTGLLPDFVVGHSARPAPASFIEGANDGRYYYNACRVPFRLIHDVMHGYNTQSKNALMKMVHWMVVQTKGDPCAIKAGYKLNGKALSKSNYFDAVFASPMVTASAADSSYQNFLDAGWPVMTRSRSNYFADTINLMCMLLVSGNWWAPEDYFKISDDSLSSIANEPDSGF